MREVLTVTDRGRARWGSAEHAIELATRATTRWNRAGDHSQTTVAHEVRFDAPEVGFRRFDTGQARQAFIAGTLTGVALEPVRSPVDELVPHPLSVAVGQRLAIVDFVWDYVQLRFEEAEGPSPLNLYVMPRLRRDGATLRTGEPGYADALVRLIGTALVGADEVLDLGLVLTFDDGTLATVPLDGTDMDGAEVAECAASKTIGHMVWRPGDEPIDWLSELP